MDKEDKAKQWRKDSMSKCTGIFSSRKPSGNPVLRLPRVKGRADQTGEISTGHEGTSSWWRTRSNLVCKRSLWHQCGG